MMYIPKEGRMASGNLLFSARSTVNNTEISLEVADLDTSSLYHKMLVELPLDIQAGEYEYTLSDNEGELSTGILIIGELENPIEYNKVIEYEQFDS